MKNHYLYYSTRVLVSFALFCIGTSKAIAQEEREYVPFVEEGKVWYCGHTHSMDEHFPHSLEDPCGWGIDCTFTMSGDTLINGQEYKKVYCQYGDYYGDEEQHYYCAVREEGYQVFIIEEEAKDEKTIYNFDRPEEYVTLTYNDYRFVRTNGEHRYEFLPGQLWYMVCKFTESGEVDYSNDIGGWIDGVGNLGTNPFAFELPFAPLGVPKLGKRIGLRSCMKDGKYIYNPEWMTMPIDPSIVDSKHIDISSKGTNFYDLQGHVLPQKPTNGIYIQNGRKYTAGGKSIVK